MECVGGIAIPLTSNEAFRLQNSDCYFPDQFLACVSFTLAGRSGFDNPIKPFPFLASDSGDRDLMEWYMLHDMPRLRIFEESLMVPFQLISPPHLCLAGDASQHQWRPFIQGLTSSYFSWRQRI